MANDRPTREIVTQTFTLVVRFLTGFIALVVEAHVVVFIVPCMAQCLLGRYRLRVMMKQGLHVVPYPCMLPPLNTT